MITLKCIVDNTALRSSALLGEHGVAFLIETPQGCLLFDTGQSGDVLTHNATQMEIDLRRCDALVLSHAHYDHTGGLASFFSLSRNGVPLYAEADLFRKRYSVKNGRAENIGLRLSKDKIVQHVDLHLSTEPTEVLPRVWTTGKIQERQNFEGRSRHHYIKSSNGWQPDPYHDDLSMVLLTEYGLVVICGCCHAGLINTLLHIQRFFPQPLRAIIGGTHLINTSEEHLKQVISTLNTMCTKQLPDLYLNHCTGEHAYTFLAQTFGKKVHTCPAGTILVFE